MGVPGQLDVLGWVMPAAGMTIPDQRVSSALFGELRCFRNVQAAAGTSPSLFGGSPCIVKVDAQSSYWTARSARFSADGRLS